MASSFQSNQCTTKTPLSSPDKVVDGELGKYVQPPVRKFSRHHEAFLTTCGSSTPSLSPPRAAVRALVTLEERGIEDLLGITLALYADPPAELEVIDYEVLRDTGIPVELDILQQQAVSLLPLGN